MYSSYHAASFARKWELSRRHGVNLDAALTWAFTFEDQPFFAGFRQLASGGIDLPVLNVFRMFSKMNGQQLAVASDAAVSLDDIKKSGVRGRPDVSALANADAGKLAVMLWHYHDDDVAGPGADVSLALQSVPFRAKAKVVRYLIDSRHSNSFAAWQEMGSPAQPTPEQFVRLEKAGQLAQVGSAETLDVKDGVVSLNVTLSRQAVMLLVLSPE